MHAHDLEERSHFVGVGQAAMRGDMGGELLARQVARQDLGARRDPKTFEERTLGCHRSSGGGCGSLR